MRNFFRRKTEEEKLYDDYSREYDRDRRLYENWRNKAKEVVDDYNNATSLDDKKRIFADFFYEGYDLVSWGDMSEEEVDRQFQNKMQNYAVELNTYDDELKYLTAKNWGDRAKRKFK